MEAKVYDWNKANEAENYTLRSWAWYKKDEKKNILISGRHDIGLGCEFHTEYITTTGMQPLVRKEDYELMRKAYEGKNLFGPRGEMGIRGNTKIVFWRLKKAGKRLCHSVQLRTVVDVVG
ncbi:hypothetical protein DFP73DRAFT_598790 [Morchella snyderi]|nr:hypothetical protein DFP73DRAFT_598790 [Morchella snyderi]